MTIKCPKCSFDNTSDSKFCKECGTQLFPSEKIPSRTETLETPSEELIRGTTFAGRYEIIEELGKGGMGRVYRVEDTKLNQEVALKLIKPEIAKDKKTIERFRNELKLARNIRHKNVCGMFDLGESEGAHFITMEYVAGEDLKSFVHRARRLDAGTAIAIAKQVGEGLAEAHRLGVVHRDLKPGNIMIDKDGNARIMDFGIARSLAGKGITGAEVIIGTPEYMSPEQIEGKEVDQRSDIYSLGVILYQMVTGRLPFEGDTPLSVAVKQKTEAPRNPRSINAQIPEDLSLAILKCLEKEKDKRYQTAKEVLADLEKIEKGIPTAERVIPKKEPLTSREITVKFRLKKVIVPAVALVAVAVIGIALIKILPKKSLPAAPSKRSIAVLPFENLGDPKEDEAFSSGITEDITTQLSKISELDVRSSESAMRYKKSTLGIKEIGLELNAVHVLVGSVRRADSTVRITTRLIDTAKDKIIWADTFNRDSKEIFAIQSDIAQQIAAALKATLTPAEKERIEKKPTKDIRAYEYYVKGREYYSRYKKEDNEQAIELFKKAVELDPDYALAHAGLADGYSQRAVRFGFPEAGWLDRAIEQAQKAISLDPNLAEGYKALGLAYYFKGWSRKAVEAGQKAVEANPNSAIACNALGEYYWNIGEFDQGFLFIKKAIALDPASAFPCSDLGRIYVVLNDPERAEEWLKKALALQPDLDVVHVGLLELYLTFGEYNKAVEQSQTYLSKFPGDPDGILYAAQAELFSGHYEKAQEYYQELGRQPIALSDIERNPFELGYIYWRAGRKAEARELFQRFQDLFRKRLEQGDENYSHRFSMAAIYAVQGNKEEALRWLQKAADAGWCNYNYASRYPLLENIRDDERFKRIMDDVKAKVAEMRQRVEQLETDSSK